MNKKIIYIGAALMLVLAITAFKLFPSQNKQMLKALDIGVGELIVKVTANGTVTPRNKIVVNTPISGRVDEVLVEEGVFVQKGDILAYLSSSDRVALMDSITEGVSENELEELKKMYLPIPILAPSTGTIVVRNVNQGQSVNQETRLFEISDVLIVVSKVDETDISKISKGQEVLVNVDAYSSELFEGVVERIGQQSTVTNNVTTYDVYIHLSKDFPGKIKSGMSASLEYVVSKKSGAMLLPTWLSEGRKNTTIQLKIRDAEGHELMRTVVLGESNGEFVEVVEGLTLTDKVLYLPMNYEMDTKGLPFSVGSKRN